MDRKKRGRTDDILLESDDDTAISSLTTGQSPTTAVSPTTAGVSPYLSKILEDEVPGVGADGRAAYILQRKRDALNCYLRTCCMRLAPDIVVECDGI